MVNISTTAQSVYFRNVDDSQAIEDTASTHTGRPGRQCCYQIAKTYQAIRKLGHRRVCQALVTGVVVGTTLGGTCGLVMANSSSILVSTSVGVGVSALSSMIFSALCLRCVYLNNKADSDTQRTESTVTTQPQSQPEYQPQSQSAEPGQIAPCENNIKTQQAPQGEGCDSEREVPPPTYCEVMGYDME